MIQQLLQEIVTSNQLKRQLLATLANYEIHFSAGKKIVNNDFKTNNYGSAHTGPTWLSQQ